MTFIVPTIGRESLRNAIDSLLSQTDEDWEAIILGDGRRAQATLRDLPWYEGGKMHFGWIGQLDSAGLIRNFAIQRMLLDRTPTYDYVLEGETFIGKRHLYPLPEWIAFLDDDDLLEPTYVEHLREQAEDYPWADVIIARMMDKKLGGVLPRFDRPQIAHGNVGISFAVKNEWMKDRLFVSEKRNEYVNEDWEMIKSLKEDGARIHISPHIDYLVRGGK